MEIIHKESDKVVKMQKMVEALKEAEEQEKEAALGGPICKDIPLLKALFEQTNGPDWLSEKRVKTNLVLFEAIHSSIRRFVD